MTTESTRPDWAVYLEIDLPEEFTDDHVDQVLERWPDVALSVGDRLGVQTSLESKTAATALVEAQSQLWQVLAAVGLRPAGDVVRAEVTTAAELDRQLQVPNAPELVGVQEVAALLQVSKQRVSELRSREGFPAPLATLAAGPVWDAAMLQRFVQTWQRTPGRPRKAAEAAAS